MHQKNCSPLRISILENSSVDSHALAFQVNFSKKKFNDLLGVMASFLPSDTFSHRIYSRISWEILATIWPKFYQFDLYTDQKKTSPKMYQNVFMCLRTFYSQKIKFLSLQILDIFFSIRLIQGSTYTRVFTVIVYSRYHRLITWGSQALMHHRLQKIVIKTACPTVFLHSPQLWRLNMTVSHNSENIANSSSFFHFKNAFLIKDIRHI